MQRPILAITTAIFLPPAGFESMRMEHNNMLQGLQHFLQEEKEELQSKQDRMA